MFLDIISDFVLPQSGLQYQARAAHFKFKVTQMHVDISIYAWVGYLVTTTTQVIKL